MAGITRSMVRDVQIALLQERLSKQTIDGALASLSAVFGYALDEDLIEVNPALSMRVDPDDPRLDPARPRRARRFVPPDELAKLLVEVAPRWRGACLAPLPAGSGPRSCSPSSAPIGTRSGCERVFGCMSVQTPEGAKTERRRTKGSGQTCSLVPARTRLRDGGAVAP
jgi:hypothetical protein